MSSNVFADLEMHDPKERLLKAKLVLAIRDLIDASGLTQAQVASRVAMSQPAVSRMLNGMTRDISVEKLLNVIVALGHNVSIFIEEQEMDRTADTIAVTRRRMADNLLGV